MFKVGDFIKTKDGEIGIVGWTENKCMDIKAEDGYVGINLKTGYKGFLAPVKIDECKKSNLDELLKYLENKKDEILERLSHYKNKQEEFEQKCKENELLKQLLSIYIK